jgi:hypothetical protein
MSLKTTYILFALLAVMLILFGIAVWKDPSGSDTDYLFPRLHQEGNPAAPEKIDQVDRVEVKVNKPEEETWVFERSGEGRSWHITQPRAYQADGPKVEQLVRQVLDARREPTADSISDLSKAELSPPNRTITLKQGDQTTAVLNIGLVGPGKDNPLVQVSAGDKPKDAVAVRKLQLEQALKGLNDFRETYLLWAHSSDINNFSVSKGDRAVELKKGSSERWAYVKPPYGDAAVEGFNEAKPDKPPQNVRSALTDLSNLRVESDKDFIKDDAGDLAEYGLGPKDKVLRLAIEYVESISRKSDEEKSETKTGKAVLLVAVGKKVGDKKDQYYACREGEKDVVRVSAAHVDPFLKLLESPDALRDRDLISLTSASKPDAIEVRNSYGQLQFRRSDDVTQAWHLYRGDKDAKGYAADKAAVDHLVSLLTRKNSIESFPDPKKRAELGLDKPDVVVSLWVDGLKKADKKGERPQLKNPEKPDIELRFGNKQGSSVAVERRRKDDKEGLVAMIGADVLDQVRKAPLEYVSRELPSFAPAAFDPGENVTRLELRRDGRTFELTHELKKDAPWKIAKPTSLAGRTADSQAVGDILHTLNHLRATEVVADKIPEGPQLDAEYGLKSPPTRVTLTVKKDGKDTTVEHDFGKTVDAKKAVYARTSQSELIVLVPTSVLETLQKELQDPTIFSFDVTKVTEVKLTGWQDLQRKLGADEPLVLQFQRKGPTWRAIKPSEKFNLDASKLEAFLLDLSHLRAERFVAHESKPTPDQELDLSKGALEIALTVEGEKEPLKLTVGKVTGDKGGYFATSSKQPGDILEVRKSAFEGPRGEPAYFRK